MRNEDDDDWIATTPQSGMGIASFLISIAAAVALVAVVGVAGVMEMDNPGRFDEESPEAAMVGLVFLGGLALELLAAGLGIGGLCSRNLKKVFATLGLAFSAITVVGLAGLLVIGLAMAG